MPIHEGNRVVQALHKVRRAASAVRAKLSRKKK